jgi:hypothetical protein
LSISQLLFVHFAAFCLSFRSEAEKSAVAFAVAFLVVILREAEDLPPPLLLPLPLTTKKLAEFSSAS